MTQHSLDAAGTGALTDDTAQTSASSTPTNTRPRRRTTSRPRTRASAQTNATVTPATPAVEDNVNATNAANAANAANTANTTTPNPATAPAEAASAEAAPAQRGGGRPRRRTGHRGGRTRGTSETQTPEAETTATIPAERGEQAAQPAATAASQGEESVVPVLTMQAQPTIPTAQVPTTGEPHPPFPAPPEPQPVPAPPMPPEPTPPTPPTEPETRMDITLSPAAVESLVNTPATTVAPIGETAHTAEATEPTPRKYRFSRSERLATQQSSAATAGVRPERLSGWRATPPPTHGAVAGLNGAAPAVVTTPPSTPTPEEPFTPEPTPIEEYEAQRPGAEETRPEIVAVLPPAGEAQVAEPWEEAEQELEGQPELGFTFGEPFNEAQEPEFDLTAAISGHLDHEEEAEDEAQQAIAEEQSAGRRRRRRRRQHTPETEAETPSAAPSAAPQTTPPAAPLAHTVAAEAREARESQGRSTRGRRPRSSQVAAEYEQGYGQEYAQVERPSPYEAPLPHPDYDGYLSPEAEEEYQPYYPVPQQQAPWNGQPQSRGTRNPYGSPEPSYVRGFGPQPYGVATPLREPLPRQGRTRGDRDVDAPPMSANQLGNVITNAIQRQTDRLLTELRQQPTPPSMTVMFPPFPSTERVGVFVDVANLVYSARNMRMGLDFGRLLDFLRGNRRLVRAQAYAPTNPDPNADQMFLSVVKGLGYRITTKNFKTFSSGAKKADMDLDLCMDIVRLVDADAVDTVVLVSGDSDFLPLLEYCSDHGVRVEVAAFEDAASAILRQSCDVFINLSLVDDIRM